MCNPGEESVSSDTAGLYLKVSPSSPAFYAIWEDADSGSTTHKVRNELNRTASRGVLLKQFQSKAPVSLTAAKHIAKSRTNEGVVIKVDPGVSLACSRWAHTSPPRTPPVGKEGESDGSESFD